MATRVQATILAILGQAICTGRASGDERTSPVEPPRHIVTIAPNSAEIICALGAGDRIVGVSKFCVYPPELANRPRVGGLFDPDLERIVALCPDLVVLRGKSDPLEKLCSTRRIRIYRDQTDTIAGIATCITELGAILGRSEEAETLADQFDNRLDVVRRRISGRSRPRVLLTVSRQPDKMANVLTTGRGTFLDEMIEIAGGINAFGHLDMAYPQVSTEALIAQHPNVIVELMPEAGLSDEARKRLLSQWSQFGSIPAVAEGRVYFLDEDNCLIPSPRYVEIIEQVSRLLHPESTGEP